MEKAFWMWQRWPEGWERGRKKDRGTRPGAGAAEGKVHCDPAPRFPNPAVNLHAFCELHPSSPLPWQSPWPPSAGCMAGKQSPGSDTRLRVMGKGPKRLQAQTQGIPCRSLAQHYLPYKRAGSTEENQTSKASPSVFIRRGRKRGEGLMGLGPGSRLCCPLSLQPQLV